MQPISASLRLGSTAPFEEIWQRWRTVGNAVSDLTGLRFELQISRFRDERALLLNQLHRPVIKVIFGFRLVTDVFFKSVL